MTTSSCSDLLEIVFAIHKVNKSPADWKTLLDTMRSCLQADFAVGVARFPTPRDRGLIYHSGFEIKHLQDYQCDTAALRKYAILHDNQHFPTAELISEGHAIYDCIAHSYPIRQGMIYDCMIDGGIAFRLFLGRWTGRPVFGVSALAHLNTFGKHLTRAMSNEAHAAKVTDEAHLLRQLVDDYPVSTFILDNEQRIHYTNQRALRLLEQNPLFAAHEGRLEVGTKDFSDTFLRMARSLLENCSTGQSEAAEVISVGDYQVLLRALPMAENTPRVSVHIFDSGATPTPDRILLQKLFRLTNAETRLAVLLAQGHTIGDATDVLGISKHTARTHLRSMFVKCGVSRQANLVQKIVTSAAMLH